MTKEELLKEAEKNILNLKNNLIKISGKPFQINEGDYRQGYLDGAEPREKRIEELEQKLEQTEKDLADYQFNYPTIKELEQENRLLGERCTQLLKDKGDLTDKIDDIKANCDLAIEGRDIKIKELEKGCEETQELLDKQIEATYKLDKKNEELNDEVRELKLLVSSLLYEINQIWDINEMNDDLRMCAEKIDKEVQLSKMAEDNRMVISALGFAIVPPKPKLDVKEIKE